MPPHTTLLKKLLESAPSAERCSQSADVTFSFSSVASPVINSFLKFHHPSLTFVKLTQCWLHLFFVHVLICTVDLNLYIESALSFVLKRIETLSFLEMDDPATKTLLIQFWKKVLNIISFICLLYNHTESSWLPKIADAPIWSDN